MIKKNLIIIAVLEVMLYYWVNSTKIDETPSSDPFALYSCEDYSVEASSIKLRETNMSIKTQLVKLTSIK